MFGHLSRRKQRLFEASQFVCDPLESRILLSTTAFRPPAVPLITSDPYLSIWSETNNLTDSNTVQWTGAENSLVSIIQIDGVSYRLMGVDPANLPAFPQVSVQVLPTQSIYNFDNGHVHVTMTFMQPALGYDLTALSLPLSYITWSVYSDDGQTHAVQIYDSVSSELAVDANTQTVTWQRGSDGPLTTLDVGSTAQTYFDPSGDQVGINWGYAYLVGSTSQITSSIGADTTEINTFLSTGALTNTDDPDVPRAVDQNMPVMAMAFNLGAVGSTAVQRDVIVAYNEVYSIDYFGENLTPYWARNGTTVDEMLTTAANNYSTYVNETTSFDSELMTDMTSEGGSDYAQLGALAYRQTFAAMGMAADPNGNLLVFSKENSSNGDVSTVDVLFPMFPQLLLFSPTLAKAALQPVLDYANSSLWTFSYSPHDLGTYPLVFGRPDGGESMPVEESANMLIMLDAIAKEENSPEFAAQFWPLITRWAIYLEPYAYEPGTQLTTDDFLGDITNSTNLAVKAIVALGAYADLAKRMGQPNVASTFTSMAQGDVTHWMNESISSDGTHWLMSYNDQGTGSQLYNLVYDQILGTDLFPASVAALDISYDKSVLTRFGVPIRSTTNIVGVDWSAFDASLATNLSDFETLIDPIYTFLNATTDRQPMTDKYDDTNLDSGLFKARSVVGGIFVKMLTDPTMWSKYSSMDQTQQGAYAGFPVTTVVVPSAQEDPQTWSYTTGTPAANWMDPGFDDSAWATGLGGFGSPGTPGIVIGTDWTARDIYLLRTFTMPAGSYSNLDFEVFHDEDITIYINGILAASATGYVSQYIDLPISAAALAQLTPGNQITLAVQCQNIIGGQGVDVGIVNVQPGVRNGAIQGAVTNGQAGETINLVAASSGQADSPALTTTLNADGVYNFSNVPPGSYIIQQVLSAGYKEVKLGHSGGDKVTITGGLVLYNENFVDKTSKSHSTKK